MKAAGGGIASLVAGVILYLVASWINLTYYDEGPDAGPGWLHALVFCAIGLAVLGLVSLAWAAVRALRSGR